VVGERRRARRISSRPRPLTELKVSYLLRGNFSEESIPPKVDEWSENVDGRGRGLEEMRRELALRAAVLGWFPVIVDAPAVSEGASVAQAREENDGAEPSPRMIPLLPAHLLDYECGEDGQLEWAKVRIDRWERSDWRGARTLVSTYRIFRADTIETFEVRRGDDGKGEAEVFELGEVSHSFGRVPIVIFRASAEVGDDPIVCESIAADVAIIARRLFNLLSEFDEHLRGQVFAVLQVPTKGGAEALREISLGVDNAIAVPPDSSQSIAYIAPPASVAATYEARIERTTQDMYRVARVEYTRPTGLESSAASRRSEFDATNMAIADLAAALARAMREVYELVGAFFRVSDNELRTMQIVPPMSFDIDSLAEDVETTKGTLEIEAGATYRKLVLMRWVDRVLPRLSEADRAKIEGEVDRVVQESEAAASAMRAGLGAEGTDEDDEDEGDDDGGRGSDRAAGARPAPGAGAPNARGA